MYLLQHLNKRDLHVYVSKIVFVFTCKQKEKIPNFQELFKAGRIRNKYSIYYLQETYYARSEFTGYNYRNIQYT